MSLPSELSGIFANKQKSYKMVLIIALLQEMNASGKREVSLENVKTRFLSFMRQREANNEPVDPPISPATRWADATRSQVTQIMYSPIAALGSILDQDHQAQTLSFKERLYRSWDQGVLNELYNHAFQQLEEYHRNPRSTSFTIGGALSNVLKKYLAAKREPLKNNDLGEYVRHQIRSGLSALDFIANEPTLKVQASVGQGVWATVPWIAIMDTRLTNTTQKGVYIVYLFAEDMNAVYLTLAQGVTELNKMYGKVQAHQMLRSKALEVRKLIPLSGLNKDEEIYLTSGGLGQDYQVSTIAYYKYDRENLPPEERLVSDLANLVSNYMQFVEIELQSQEEQERATTADQEPESLPQLSTTEWIKHAKAYIQSRGFTFPDLLIENFYLSLKTKPFVILAGVSGTGKTKLVQLFAEALGATSDNNQYTLIPVRPDWSDPADLIGYKDLNDRFRPGPITNVLVEASKPANRNKPYFVCLDEMNLARVEHYFSDLLSILESQKRKDGQVVTDRLIHSSALVTSEDIETYGDLRITDNVYIVGTVNMDETTHPFSKKVLDRANTIEFNEIRLDQFPTMSSDTMTPVSSQPAPNTFLRSEYLQLIDAYQGHQVDTIRDAVDKLVRINGILESVHAHVGFRIRDAVCFYLLYNEQAGFMTRDQAMDLQLLQKILPRIQGSDRSVKRVLLELLAFSLDCNLNMNDLEEDASELWANVAKTTEKAPYPLSASKILFMLRRLDEDGFTSYWLS